jgi:hypothetical protein
MAPIFIGDNVMVFDCHDRVKGAVLYLKQKTVVLCIDSHPSRFVQTWMIPYQYLPQCVQLIAVVLGETCNYDG